LSTSLSQPEILKQGSSRDLPERIDPERERKPSAKALFCTPLA